LKQAFTEQVNTPGRTVSFHPGDINADRGFDRSDKWSADASPLPVGHAVGRAGSPSQRFHWLRSPVNHTKPDLPREDNFRRTLPTIKLEQYNGSSPLETHLAKLDNCAEYYN